MSWGGWIVSAHFTVSLGATKQSDGDFAPEQRFEYILPKYQQVMLDVWPGWIGHPFQWCVGENIDSVIKEFLGTAVETKRLMELPIRPFRRKPLRYVDEARRSLPLFRPEIIASFQEYSEHTGNPLVIISLDAHHLDDLKYGLENSFHLSEWMISEGVSPKQIWSYE